MKNNIKVAFCLFVLMFIAQCAAQKENSGAVTASLVSSKNFTFHAERAHPVSYDVLNVLNSLPNAPASRIMQISGQGYKIILTPQKAEVALPYFGRAFTPPVGSRENSLRFTTKDFVLSETQGKRGKTIITVKPKEYEVTDLIIEVFPNGKAFVSVKSNDRQPITFDGYISPTATADQMP